MRVDPIAGARTGKLAIGATISRHDMVEKDVD
jgi:hypothetical protein